MEHWGRLGPIICGAALVVSIRITGAGLVYASHVLLARWLGAFEFGIYVYAWVWVTVLSSLAPLGLTNAVVRFIPEYIIKKKWRRVMGVIRQSRVITLSAGIVIALIGTLVIRVGADSIASHYVVPLYIGMACVPFFALILLYTDQARSFGWLGLAYIPLFIARPTFLIIGVGIVLLADHTATGTTALGVAALYCILILLGQAALFSTRVPIAIREARPVYHTRHWFRIAFPLLLMQGFDLLLSNTDLIMLGVFVEPDEIAAYTAAVRTAGLISFVLYAVIALAAPKYSILNAENKSRELRTMVIGVVRWIFWPSVVLAAGLLILGQSILALFGPTFVAVYPVMTVLIVGHLVIASTGSSAPLLNVTGHQTECARVIGSAAALNIMLNLVFIPLFGLIGAAMATTISMSVTALWLITIVKRRFGFYSFAFARVETEAR